MKIQKHKIGTRIAIEGVMRSPNEFLAKQKILIVDSDQQTKFNIAKMLFELGARTHHFTLVDDFEQAKRSIQLERPDIVIAEYLVPNGIGLDLAAEFNRVRTERSIFIMLTENELQSSLSQAAEEDVDLYILKPYTNSYFIKRLVKVINEKIEPGEYTKKIYQGKRLLEEKSWDAAIQWFNQAIHQSSAPSLAYYYRSQAEIQKLLLEVAEHSLRVGLGHQGNHYKCLNGLFELLFLQDKFKEAYDVMKKLNQFPLNSKKLSRAISLAIRTAQYSDVEKFYDSYRTIPVKDETLSKHMSAALVVSSKMLFQKGEMYKAAAYLKKAANSASGHPNLLMEIVTTLALNGFVPNAKEAIELFSAQSKTSYHYRIAQAMLAFGENRRSDRPVKLLQRTIDEGMGRPECYYWLIAFLKASKKDEEAETFLERAKNTWPDRKEYFERALVERFLQL